VAPEKDGCVNSARGPILSDQPGKVDQAAVQGVKEMKRMLAKVGKEAIDFEANAFLAGEGFKPVRLSDHRGKWIVLCFYPGDFTFV
jgi:hypothetical protein